MVGFGARVNRYRKWRGLSIDQLTEAASALKPVGGAWVRKILYGGRVSPTLADILILSKALRVPALALAIDLERPFDPCDIEPYEGMPNYRVFREMEMTFGQYDPDGLIHRGKLLVQAVELIGSNIERLDTLMQQRQQFADKITDEATTVGHTRSGTAIKLTTPTSTFLDILQTEDAISEAWLMISQGRRFLFDNGVHIPDIEPADGPGITDPIIRFLGPDYEAHVIKEQERSSRNGSLSQDVFQEDPIASTIIPDQTREEWEKQQETQTNLDRALTRRMEQDDQDDA